jgi:hypothetical protein
MKKFIYALCFVLLLPGLSWGAIAATTVWELRATATAGNLNGCGFNPSNASVGSDYTLQNAAQDDGTDLACTNVATNPCVVTSVTHNFVAADNGNLIHITAGTGFTAGWYEVVSTAGNAATLDRACGSSGSRTGGTWYLGGACSMGSTLDNEMAAATVAGNTVYVASGSYTTGESITFTNGSSSANPVYVLGYIGTRSTPAMGTDRPVIAAGNTIIDTGTYHIVKNIIFSGSTSKTLYGHEYSIFENIKVTNTSATSTHTACQVLEDSQIYFSEFSSVNGRGLTAGTGFFYGNYFHDCATYCIYVNNTSPVFANNIISTCGTAGAQIDYAIPAVFINNTFFGANDADAVGLNVVINLRVFAYNNAFVDWYDGIAVVTAATMVEDYNAYYSNSHANYAAIGAHSFVTNADPFIDSANGDFRVTAELEGRGWPLGGTINGVAEAVGYNDIGALGRSVSTSSGSKANAW